MCEGRIYIASAFQNTQEPGYCSGNEVDNDPHVWNKPYTWGICRPDLRNTINKGYYVFFVLGKKAKPQMIFAYVKIKEIICHKEAYFRKELRKKRMGRKKVQGNIIVDKKGNHNKFDHHKNFHEIKKRYAVAYINKSRKLMEKDIERKSKDFVRVLRKILHKKGKMPIDIISRKGRRLNELQVKHLLKWLKS